MSAQKVFSALGSVLRQTGQTIDAIGLRLQGKFGYKEGGVNLRSRLLLLRSRVHTLMH